MPIGSVEAELDELVEPSVRCDEVFSEGVDDTVLVVPLELTAPVVRVSEALVEGETPVEVSWPNSALGGFGVSAALVVPPEAGGNCSAAGRT